MNLIIYRLKKCEKTFTKFYAVTDEKFKKKDFDKFVKKEDQFITKGIEVGHIFYFGDKYSKPMNCLIDDKSGKKNFSKNGFLRNWCIKISRSNY